MNDLAYLSGILGALTLGAMSPGPSFLMVARTAVTASRRDGLAAAAGMGAGGALFAVIALFGLHLLLTHVPWLHMVLKLAGGAYLVYLGWGIWRGASQPLHDAACPAAASTVLRSFWLGLATQASNPKTAIVYASVFTAFLPADFSLALGVVLTALVFVVETLWYAFVAVALSSAAPRACYLRYKQWVDRAAGGVMATLGARLIVTAPAA